MNILFFLTPKNEVFYIYDNTSVDEAAEIMEKSGYSAVPVIDRNGMFAGTLTEGDLLYTIRKHNIKCSDIIIKDIMKRAASKPISVNDKIEDLVLQSLDQNFIPVIDDNNIFIGIVTRKNIIQYCYNRYIAAQI